MIAQKIISRMIRSPSRARSRLLMVSLSGLVAKYSISVKVVATRLAANMQDNIPRMQLAQSVVVL